MCGREEFFFGRPFFGRSGFLSDAVAFDGEVVDFSITGPPFGNRLATKLLRLDVPVCCQTIGYARGNPTFSGVYSLE